MGSLAPTRPLRVPSSSVFEEYEKIANKTIEESIKSETHGSLEEAMLTVGKGHTRVCRAQRLSVPCTDTAIPALPTYAQCRVRVCVWV